MTTSNLNEGTESAVIMQPVITLNDRMRQHAATFLRKTPTGVLPTQLGSNLLRWVAHKVMSDGGIVKWPDPEEWSEKALSAEFKTSTVVWGSNINTVKKISAHMTKLCAAVSQSRECYKTLEDAWWSKYRKDLIEVTKSAFTLTTKGVAASMKILCLSVSRSWGVVKARRLSEYQAKKPLDADYCDGMFRCPECGFKSVVIGTTAQGEHLNITCLRSS